MRQRRSHPQFVVKIEAGYEIAQTQIVSASELLGMPYSHRPNCVPCEIGVLYEQGLDVKCFSLSGSLLLSLRLLLLSTGFVFAL